MTYEEFTKSEPLVKAWREQLETNETLKTVLSVMADEAPMKEEIDNENPTAVAVQYGFVRGYASFARKLKDLTIYQRPPQNIPTTYAKPHA